MSRRTSEGPNEELDALHRRAAELEEELALPPGQPLPRPPEPPRSPRRFFGFALAMVGIGAATTLGFVGSGRPSLTVGGDRPAPLYAGPLEILDDAAPSLLDVDGDGRRDLVVRGVRRDASRGHGAPGRDLYVVAIDGRTLVPRWRAGPFASTEEDRGSMLALEDGPCPEPRDGKAGLARSPGSCNVVVLADSVAGFHVLDAATGATLGSFVHGAPALRVEKLGRGPRGSQQVLFSLRGALHTGGSIRSFSRATLPRGPVVDDATEEAVEAAACATAPARTCAATREPASNPVVERLYPRHVLHTELRSGDLLASLVHTRVAGAGVVLTTAGALATGIGSEEHVIVWDDSLQVRWNAPLRPPEQRWQPHPESVEQGSVALGGGRVLYLYPTREGVRRLVARDAWRGGILYDVPVPLGFGARVRSFSADGDRAFVVASGAIFVLDATTGDVVRRLDALREPG